MVFHEICPSYSLGKSIRSKLKLNISNCVHTVQSLILCVHRFDGEHSFPHGQITPNYVPHPLQPTGTLTRINDNFNRLDMMHFISKIKISP